MYVKQSGKNPIHNAVLGKVKQPKKMFVPNKVYHEDFMCTMSFK